MTDENSVCLLIEQNLQSFVAHGIARKPGDAEACLRYWQRLSPADRLMFEEIVQGGTFAGSAAEMVEMLTEREKPQGKQKMPVAVG